MARSTRLFEIIQLLRAASQPMTAAQIADTLEVTKRTVYRDIVSLQALRVPVVGEAGVGYILRPDFDLPPVNFDTEEVEALTVGLALVARTGDPSLIHAGRRAAAKLFADAPAAPALRTLGHGVEVPQNVSLSRLRCAIRDEDGIDLTYEDEAGEVTRRVVLPLALIYMTEAVVLAAWCALREDFRHFRIDRIVSSRPSGTDFKGRGAALRSDWEARNPGW